MYEKHKTEVQESILKSVTKPEAGLGRLVPAKLLVLVLRLFLIEYRKTKTKTITVVNHSEQTTHEVNIRVVEEKRGKTCVSV